MKCFFPKLTGAVLWVLLALAVAALIAFPQETSAAVSEGLLLCQNVLLPSLFPFFVLSSMVISSGLAQALGKLCTPLMRPLFGVPGSCACAFFLGLLSGYPVGAQTAASLYREKLCTKAEGERLLAFCNNSGPAFILGAVGLGIFQSREIGILLYSCHLAASVTVGLFFRLYQRKQSSRGEQKIAAPPRLPFSDLLTQSVGAAVRSMALICGFVLFFSVLIRLLSRGGLPPQWGGILEITTGIRELAASSLPLPVRVLAASAVLGWGGVSVHCQVLSLLAGSGLSPKPYLLGKLLHGALSAVYTLPALALFPLSEAAFAESRALSVAEGAPFPQALFSPAFYGLSAAIFLLFVLFFVFIRHNLCYTESLRAGACSRQKQ